jgi:inorganic pyrophosphatase
MTHDELGRPSVPNSPDPNPTAAYLRQEVVVQIDRPMGSRHPVQGFIYPVNYGYLPDTVAADGEAVDVYVLGIFEPVTCFTGRCIAVIHRTDDAEDKLVVVPEKVEYTDDQIRALTEFQERFFTSVIWRPGA